MDVDEFWHSFILFTRQYQNWCTKHFGAFIHHNPTDSPDTTLWQRSVNLMKEIYDIDWTPKTEAGCGSNCGAGDAASGCGNCGSTTKCSSGDAAAGCGSNCGGEGAAGEGAAGCGSCSGDSA